MISTIQYYTFNTTMPEGFDSDGEFWSDIRVSEPSPSPVFYDNSPLLHPRKSRWQRVCAWFRSLFCCQPKE